MKVLPTLLLAAPALASWNCIDGQATSWNTSLETLSSPSSPWDCHHIYTWQDGDTFWDVARSFDIEIDAIVIWNCFLDPTVLEPVQAGDTICVAASLDGSPVQTQVFVSIDASSMNVLPRTGSIVSAVPDKTDSEAEAFTTIATPGRAKPNGELRRRDSQMIMMSGGKHDACDADTSHAEDCRITMADMCDHKKGEYPTCDGGYCVCAMHPCQTTSACATHNNCRSDDQEIDCHSDKLFPDYHGVCGCKARTTDCFNNGTNPHTYCSKEIDCTEHGFSLYPEFAQCITENFDKRGSCACRMIECPFVRGQGGDHEVCRKRMTCPEDDQEPFCNLKYFDHGDDPARKGYCTCTGDFGLDPDS